MVRFGTVWYSTVRLTGFDGVGQIQGPCPNGRQRVWALDNKQMSGLVWSNGRQRVLAILSCNSVKGAHENVQALLERPIRTPTHKDNIKQANKSRNQQTKRTNTLVNQVRLTTNRPPKTIGIAEFINKMEYATCQSSTIRIC